MVINLNVHETGLLRNLQSTMAAPPEGDVYTALSGRLEQVRYDSQEARLITRLYVHWHIDSPVPTANWLWEFLGETRDEG
jgi:hypothetical protein